MMYKSLLAGSAIFAATGSALADKPAKYSSSATCDFSAVTTASAQSQTAIAKIVKKLDGVLCGDHPHVEEKAYDVAHATAKAFAQAVAKVEVDCFATGTAKYSVEGQTVGVAHAKAVAKAYAKAIATGTCGRCHAASTTVAEAVDEIYVSATAEIIGNFSGAADGGEAATDVSIMVEAYEERTLDAFAQAIVYAKASDGECTASTKSVARAGDNEAVCVLTTTAASKTLSEDASAEVLASVTDIVCNAESSTSVTLSAKAYARAVAEAIAKAYGSCRVSGDAYGCVDGSAEIKAIATAAATAFADGFAKAVSLCYNRCKINADAFTLATADIIATAYAQVNAEFCTDKFGSFDLIAFEAQLIEVSTPVLAELMIQTVADVKDGCTVIVNPSVTIGPSTTKELPVPVHPVNPVHPVHPTHPVVIPSTESSESSEEEKHTPRRGKKGGKKGRKNNRRHGKKGGRKGPKKARRHGKKGGRKGPKKARRNGKKGPRRGKAARK